MALGTVQAGYKNSLYMYPVWSKAESEFSYAELLAELTTELELACRSGDEEPVMEEGAGEDSEQTDAHLERKKEWEELLEHTEVVEAMLRQMMEQGLGQQKEEQKSTPKKQKENDLDNDFDLRGVPVSSEGGSKKSDMSAGLPGNSQFLQTNGGRGAEYWSLSNGGRKTAEYSRAICLTCQTECDKKKQWKIAE